MNVYAEARGLLRCCSSGDTQITFETSSLIDLEPNKLAGELQGSVCFYLPIAEIINLHSHVQIYSVDKTQDPILTKKTL